MDKDIILARVRRSKLPEFCGEAYCDSLPRVAAPFVDRDLFLFAIYSSDLKWTAVSIDTVDFVFDGQHDRLEIACAAQCIHDELLSREKGNELSTIQIGSNKKTIWLVDIRTACAVLNILNILERRMKDR